MLATVFFTACSGSGESKDAAEATSEEAVTEAPPPVPDMPDTPADVAAPPADAQTTESGLASKVLKKGTGSGHPTEKSLVTVHYTGWTTDGEMFDSSIKRGRPALFGLNGVIKGWTEGLQLMVPGESRRFWIPAEMAYGEETTGGRPSGMLVFDIELIEFENPPENLESAPADATTTESGLAYKQLSAGTGTRAPTEDDMVEVHFVAWDKEGNMAQTSRRAPRPLAFKLDGAIPGWKEAIQLMKVGEKARFWMPPELVPVPGGPNGIAVFDFELLKLHAPLPAPDNVKAAPSDATKTESGLAFKVLKAADEGAEKPTEDNVVEVKFTAWSSETGKMLETTNFADRPAMMPLSGVPVKGLKEALLDMGKGEQRRLWIPEELAFGGNPDPRAPKGAIVYDVELLDIKQGGPRALPPQLREQIEGQRAKMQKLPPQPAKKLEVK